MDESLDTGQIRSWRSIVTLTVFFFTNIIVLFPFHIPIFVPRPLSNAILDTLSTLRIISPRKDLSQHGAADDDDDNGKVKPFVQLNFPMNFVTAPLIADLFLLAILAIGQKEVHDGIIGANSISPIDIMTFFITLAYIAISIDASGLIRYLAFKVLQKGGKVGHRLFFYLYAFFFSLGSFIGNDPIILSGTAFLAYMTRVSSNIQHPRAWIHTQFAIANIASAILVSSNPTNLVLAGAFNIKFVHYTVNMIVPVCVTAIVLFPFLLYIVFADQRLIPYSIEMYALSEEARNKTPVNPNIPHARGTAEEEENMAADDEQGKQLSLEEIMNPFLDKGGAAFGALIMTTTLVTLLALNAASTSSGEHPVFWVTLPAATVMFCWDVMFGWLNRHETREIARKGRQEVELARAQRTIREEEESRQAAMTEEKRDETTTEKSTPTEAYLPEVQIPSQDFAADGSDNLPTANSYEMTERNLPHLSSHPPHSPTFPKSKNADEGSTSLSTPPLESSVSVLAEGDLERRISRKVADQLARGRPTLVSAVADSYRWSQETFPTVTAVVAHLPFKLVPFAFAMFVLVQGLVTKGWVPVFAYGWDHWVNKTGTVGAVGGMGFLSVILCNFAGTNIGTTILLSRVLQTWQAIHHQNGIPITDRTFWATVYAMALGVNYGAFSTAFSASLAGLLWRDILARKHIHIRRLDFAQVNLPIIAIAMSVGLRC